MLTIPAIDYLSSLAYRQNAKRRSCLLPLSGIYWEDEIPDFQDFLRIPEEDRLLVYRLFNIRFEIWKDQDLSIEDQIFWQTAIHQVPNCPIFYRMQLTDVDRQAQQQVEEEANAFFGALMEGAESVSFTQVADGAQSFSIEFDMTKNPKHYDDE